ncbi:MAG TPA: RDD family protein [Acidimicrobiales bacterium]|nr:RDD family protein [Acidimicrobiales bacterium]
MSARHDGGTPGDDDESLDRWEDELADLDWDEDEFDLSNEDEDGEVPLDDEGRPLRGTGSLAPVWQRAIARLVDVFIIFNVAGFLAYVIVRPAEDDTGLLTTVAFAGVFWVIAGVYEAGMVAWKGQTLGKLLLRIEVVRRTDGARPTPGEAAVRYAVPTVWLLLPLPLIGQLLWMVVYLSAIPNTRRQGWHDKAASTLVVVV